MRKCLCIVLLISLWDSEYLPAQNPYIRHYTTSEGLPTNTVYYIYQDSKKFIWFATDAGVVRYDGTTFTHFRNKDGLTSKEIIRIKEDSFGRIWFTNYNGSMDYYYHNKIYNKTTVPFLDSIKGKIFFHDFVQDSDQTIYFYNSVNEIVSLNPNNQVNKFMLADSEFQYFHLLRYITKATGGGFNVWTHRSIVHFDSISGKPVLITGFDNLSGVFPSRDQTLYINMSSNELWKYKNISQVGFIRVPFQGPFSAIKIRSVMEDREGYLWIVTFDEGVYCLRNDRVVRHFDIPEGQAILQDHEYNIWISSMNDGIYKISPNILKHKQYNNSLFNGRGIIAISSDPFEGVWFTNGEQVYLLKENMIYTLNSHNEGNTLNLVRKVKNAILVGEKGYMFYAFKDIHTDKTTKKIYFKQRVLVPQQFRGNKYSFKNISVNSTGERICSYAGFYVFTFSTGNLFNDIKEIEIGQNVFNSFYNIKDDLVINSGVNYTYKNNTLTPSGELAFLNDKIITDHLIIKKTIELYVVEGDTIFVKQDDRFINLSAYVGSLIDRKVRNIAYHDPVLYISTSHNVYKIDDPLKILENKPVSLQLIDIYFRNIHDILVNNDSLYIASDDGLTVIPEALANNTPTCAPIPYIQSIMVNDTDTDIDPLDIKIRGSAKIKFNFSCINYSSSPVLYSYMLTGSDSTWTTGTATSIVYQNLPKGKYVFKMRVQQPTAPWSNPVEYHLEVKAVFWQHPLFFAAIALTIAVLIVILVIHRKNLIIRRREIDHQLLTLEQKALQSMMNPHFIFNSLGSIQNYLLQKKTGEAGLYLSQFARLIRQNLNAINAAMINLDEEVDRLKNYLDLEKMRLGDKFKYHIELDDAVEADEVFIPSMIIQPFAENSIWHGISPMEEKGMISIYFQKETETSLRIIIEDNGVGMRHGEGFSEKTEKHLHLGMEMTRKRLDLLGKKFKIKTSLTYSEPYPGRANPGTRIVMTVPFTYSEKVG